MNFIKTIIARFHKINEQLGTLGVTESMDLSEVFRVRATNEIALTSFRITTVLCLVAHFLITHHILTLSFPLINLTLSGFILFMNHKKIYGWSHIGLEVLLIALASGFTYFFGVNTYPHFVLLIIPIINYFTFYDLNKKMRIVMMIICFLFFAYFEFWYPRDQSIIPFSPIVTAFTLIGIATFIFHALLIFHNKINNQKKLIDAYAKELETKNTLLNDQNIEISNQSKELSELTEFKENLMGMIVHDLKNPLNAVINFSQSESNIIKHTQSIHQEGKKMLHMVLNILDVQKFEEAKVKLEYSDTLASSLVSYSVSSVLHLAQSKGIVINQQIETDYWLRIDQELISRVMVNILSNAIKYSPLNSTINLTAKSTQDHVMVFTIQDKGQGIPEEQLPYIFNKYWQYNSQTSGGVRSVGIGLTFCKLAVESHGGTIHVNSKPGIGTEIYFELPCLIKKEQIKPKDSMASTQPNDSYLSLETKQYLLPFAKKIASIGIHQLSKIWGILDEIDLQNPEVTEWKKRMERCILVTNEDEVNKQIAEITGQKTNVKIWNGKY